jgi:hypothetical protein
MLDSGSSINVRYKEHTRYIRTNNPKSAYATHILENRHEYGTRESTLQLLQACKKGTHMDCWEAFYIQALQQQIILITEQQISDVNPLFELAKVTNTLRLKPRPVHLPPCTRNNVHKYRVSTLHNLILTFHIFTIFLL